MEVKIFGVVAQSVSGKNAIEEQVNEFIKDKNVIDIKINVIRNFLPQTTQSEYEEVWYATVMYE